MHYTDINFLQILYLTICMQQVVGGITISLQLSTIIGGQTSICMSLIACTNVHAQKTYNNFSVRVFSKLQLFELGLSRKRVLVEPFQKTLVQSFSGVRVLGGVYMCVNHPRHQELAASEKTGQNIIISS